MSDETVSIPEGWTEEDYALLQTILFADMNGKETPLDTVPEQVKRDAVAKKKEKLAYMKGFEESLAKQYAEACFRAFQRHLDAKKIPYRHLNDQEIINAAGDAFSNMIHAQITHFYAMEVATGNVVKYLADHPIYRPDDVGRILAEESKTGIIIPGDRS
jgi:hypothetical protein